MEFSSHRDFITPNVLAADCCLRQWYDYKGCVCDGFHVLFPNGRGFREKSPILGLEQGWNHC